MMSRTSFVMCTIAVMLGMRNGREGTIEGRRPGSSHVVQFYDVFLL